MVQKVTSGKALPRDIIQQIVSKTDGVPLFVEELTKMVVESGLVQEEEGRYVGAHGGASIPPLAIPSTLQDSLRARLDRLAPVKDVAQLGATLGREFSYELIHAVSPLDEATLQHGLRQLVEAELIYQRGLPPRATYLFKHALIQDTAYQSLLKSKRQQLHRQSAQVLEQRFPAIVETQPELVAHHCTEAGLMDQALPYWQKAGERASQRSAYVEAINHLSTGLEVLTTLPDTPERVQQELTLQLALSEALAAVKGYAALEVEKTMLRAQELCRQLGETPQLIRVLQWLTTVRFARAEHHTARALAEQCLSLARSVHDTTFLAQAHFILSNPLYALGEFVLAHDHQQQAIPLYDPQGEKHSLMSCLSWAAWTLWYLGYPDQGLRRSEEALALVEGLARPFSRAYALVCAAKFHLLRREEQLARARAEEVIPLSTEQGFPYWLANGTMYAGRAIAEQEKGERGIELLRQGLAAMRATGTELSRPYYLALLAEAHEKAGQIEEGLRVLTEALVVVGKTGECVHEAELYRLKGTLTLQKSADRGLVSEVSNSQAEAEACFLTAIEVSRKQHAKSLELRAATSLARLWQSQGKSADAHNLLSDIYGWFTEGFDTKDLREAKALLAELV